MDENGAKKVILSRKLCRVNLEFWDGFYPIRIDLRAGLIKKKCGQFSSEVSEAVAPAYKYDKIEMKDKWYVQVILTFVIK